jgi:hypothetical protein
MKSLPKAIFMPTSMGQIRGIGGVWTASFYDIYAGFVVLNKNVTHFELWLTYLLHFLFSSKSAFTLYRLVFT